MNRRGQLNSRVYRQTQRTPLPRFTIVNNSRNVWKWSRFEIIKGKMCGSCWVSNRPLQSLQHVPRVNAVWRLCYVSFVIVLSPWLLYTNMVAQHAVCTYVANIFVLRHISIVCPAIFGMEKERWLASWGSQSISTYLYLSLK